MNEKIKYLEPLYKESVPVFSTFQEGEKWIKIKNKYKYKNSYVMQTLLLQAEIQEINLPIVEEFLKKIKAKKVKIRSVETLKEVVEKGRKDYKEGRTTKINPLNLWENI